MESFMNDRADIAAAAADGQFELGVAERAKVAGDAGESVGQRFRS